MRMIAVAMTLVIVALIAASFLFVTGMSREMRTFLGDLRVLGSVAVGSDEPLSNDPTRRRFTVQRGDTAATIGDRLQEQGFIEDGLAFRLRARGEGVDQQFEAGEYDLSPSMRPSEIIAALQRGRFAGEMLTIPEGWRLAQIADAVESKFPTSRSAFLQRATVGNHNFPFLADLPRGSSLEGYLFPDTYEFEENATPDQIVERMLQTFEKRVTPDVILRANERGLTLHQLITLASIVEREARVPAERPIIAGVFLNRLKQNMPLQADPTVQFAIRPGNEPAGATGYWKTDLTVTDLRAPSPYNTYTTNGLPPGPICSPGLDAIHAVVDAPTTDLLYFVARPDGSHVFSRSLPEHNENVRQQQSKPGG